MAKFYLKYGKEQYQYANGTNDTNGYEYVALVLFVSLVKFVYWYYPNHE